MTDSPSVDSLDHEVLSGAEQVIAFHVVTEGNCWAEIIDGGERPVALEAGDMAAFPAGDANVMGVRTRHARHTRPSLYQRPPDRTLPFSLRMSREPTADRTRFVCGFLGCDTRPIKPLLDYGSRRCSTSQDGDSSSPRSCWSHAR